MLYGFKVALILLLLSSASFAQDAEIVVVVNKMSSVDKLSKRQVKKLYLGKSKKFSNGEKAIVLDHMDGYPLRDKFYETVVGRSGERLEAYWSKLKFTGKGQPPTQVDHAQVIERLAKDTQAVGYIEKKDLTDKLKVVFAK